LSKELNMNKRFQMAAGMGATFSTGFVAIVAGLLGIGGCAGIGTPRLTVGALGEDVVRQMGAPTATHAMAEGASRLEFARGPFGRKTYMVDLDNAGRVTQASQVLVERNFEAVKVGMGSQQLLQTLGTPSHRRAGGRQGGEVWSYRYEATFCQWFQVSVIDSVVRHTAYAPDPECEIEYQ
jgi:hypothetical protein